MKRIGLIFAAIGIALAGYGWIYWMAFDAYNSTKNLIERDGDIGLAVGSIGVCVLLLSGTTCAVVEILKEAFRREDR